MFKTGQEHLGSYCKTMLQRIRNIVTFVGRSGYKVPERSWKLLQEDDTTCQEHLGSKHLDTYWKKLLQRIRKTLEVTEENVTTYQKDLGN